MRRTISILLKGLAISLVVFYIGLIFVEYFRYQDNLPMIIELKNETIPYDDGNVYVSWGLGYKTITYNRTSIYGKEFGHLFIDVREGMPSK